MGTSILYSDALFFSKIPVQDYWGFLENRNALWAPSLEKDGNLNFEKCIWSTVQWRSCRCQKSGRVESIWVFFWHFIKYIYFIWGWTTSMVIIEPLAPVLELLWLVISRLTFEVFWSEMPRTSEISFSVSSTSELELFWLWDKRCPLGLVLERSSPLELASIVIFWNTENT